MPKHLIAFDRLESLPADSAGYTAGYPVFDETTWEVYVANADETWDQITLWYQPSVTSVTEAHAVTGRYLPTVVLADATAAGFAVTLPSPFSGREVVVKKVDSSANAVTVETPDTETIDGAANRSLATQYDYVRLVSDGVNWFEV